MQSGHITIERLLRTVYLGLFSTSSPFSSSFLGHLLGHLMFTFLLCWKMHSHVLTFGRAEAAKMLPPFGHSVGLSF